MASIRVKLVFERPFARSSEQCWMLVDKTSCKLVRDLEYLIVKKFFVAGHTVLNLYLDDFLLPSQERIDIIRDNDVIRYVSYCQGSRASFNQSIVNRRYVVNDSTHYVDFPVSNL